MCVACVTNNLTLSLIYVAKSFVEFVRFLFSIPKVKDNKLAFISNHICQDPLENYFGRQEVLVTIAQHKRIIKIPNQYELLIYPCLLELA